MEETADGYEVTEAGRRLRQEAEDATDRYFFEPWICLTEPEVANLVGLVTRLRDHLQQMARDIEGSAES